MLGDLIGLSQEHRPRPAVGAGMDQDRIVAVGLLTRHDLEVLGQGFRRSYRVRDVEGFEDLLAKLEHVAAVPGKPRDDTDPH
jgi:hypothetical protein